MKKTILLFVMSMMICLGAMAQEKGPTVVETENFSVKVPKGWVVKKKVIWKYQLGNFGS